MPKKYTNIHRGRRPDLPYIPKSTWEANFGRVLRYQGLVYGVDYEYEGFPIEFRGTKGTNAIYRPDFLLRPGRGILPRFIEVKGLLRYGGRLDRLDLTQLEARDHDSAQKLRNLREHYPRLARKTWVVGAREYAWLKRRYSRRIPEWEFE